MGDGRPLRQIAGEIAGLNIDKLFADADSDRITQEAKAAAGEAKAAGIPGTPTFLVKIGDAEPYTLQIQLDLEQMRAALDDALEG